MKNKIRLKQYIISTFIVSICLFVLFLALNIYEYKTYTNNFNNKIGAIISVIKDKYPEITDKEIVTIRKLGDGDIAVNKPERLKVFFVGSFDPITKGHMNLIKQASNLFGEVVVAVMQNASKGEGFFSIDERVHIIKELYKNDRRVEVTTGTGAATDVALLHGCGAILRGLRGISDFEEEVKARQINKEISGCDLETIYLIADPEYRHISSSMVRELFALGKNIRSYVDPLVADKMIEKRK